MSDNLTVQQQNNVVPGFTSKNAFQALWNIGKILSESAFTPDKCKGKIGDCAIMAEMAIRLKCSPVMVMQEMNVIYGILRGVVNFSFLYSMSADVIVRLDINI